MLQQSFPAGSFRTPPRRPPKVLKWDADYLPISQSWRRKWSRLTPFFVYPPEIRKVIYSTNAIEPVSMGLRKLSKNRGSFSSGEALTKLFYLALRNISQK